MQLRILGCSGGIGAGLRTTSYLLGDDVLIDAGTGVGALTYPELKKIRHVFLSHSHLDHVAALPLLVDTIFEALTTPLVVHGQPETIQALKDHVLNGTIWPDFAELPSKHSPVLVYEPQRPGEHVKVHGRTFSMIPVNHVVPSVAWVVQERSRVFCFSGDTTTNDTLWEGLNALPRLDLLLIECGFPNANMELARLAKHYCPTFLAADLQRLRHRPRVAITHFKPGGEEDSWRECVALIEGRDLIRVEHNAVLEI
jgi:ribonuclease BN (tRNA processing enzyme)